MQPILQTFTSTDMEKQIEEKNTEMGNIISRSEEFIQKNQKTLIIVVVAILVVIFACNIGAVVGVPVDLHELVGLLDEDVRMVMAGVPVENRRAFEIHVR